VFEAIFFWFLFVSDDLAAGDLPAAMSAVSGTSGVVYSIKKEEGVDL
jgi:hypothetical protein